MTSPVFWRMTKFLKPYTGYVILAFAGALAEAATDLLQPWPMKLLLDHVFAKHPLPPAVAPWVSWLFGTHPAGILSFVLFAIVGVAALSAGATFAQDLIMPRVSHWVMHDLRRQLYWHIQRLS